MNEAAKNRLDAMHLVLDALKDQADGLDVPGATDHEAGQAAGLRRATVSVARHLDRLEAALGGEDA